MMTRATWIIARKERWLPPPTALPIQMQSWSKTRTIAPYSRECLARGGRRASERSSNSEGVDCPSGKASTADQYAPCPQLLMRQPYGPWDVVVVQDQSSLPFVHAARCVGALGDYM